MTKQEIRKMIFSRRNQMTMEEVESRSQRIVDKVRQDTYYQKANVVAIFYPMHQEINLLPLLLDAKTFVFPRVEKDGIHFYPYEKDQPFKKSSFGVMEPQGNKRMDHIIDYMLTPALAISKDYYRIGYGKAYYDRFLSINRPKRVVGVIYSFFVMDQIPHESHDQQLDDMIEG